ncbi:hypothetical protein NE237_023802 [Protea cynaroides]|uniref:Uncharacterized protein n=1 Tax=Protea cynaroides TaxID=273540 RepID=A0A9Q0HFP3_9MAGN|nr:hypothetical protein NE237_023802 [Protea cynaroides]
MASVGAYLIDGSSITAVAMAIVVGSILTMTAIKTTVVVVRGSVLILFPFMGMNRVAVRGWVAVKAMEFWSGFQIISRTRNCIFFIPLLSVADSNHGVSVDLSVSNEPVLAIYCPRYNNKANRRSYSMLQGLFRKYPACL